MGSVANGEFGTLSGNMDYQAGGLALLIARIRSEALEALVRSTDGSVLYICSIL